MGKNDESRHLSNMPLRSMLIAAFISRSCSTSHSGHYQMRLFNGISDKYRYSIKIATLIAPVYLLALILPLAQRLKIIFCVNSSYFVALIYYYRRVARPLVHWLDKYLIVQILKKPPHKAVW